MKFPVAFYREVLAALNEAELPFLVGGAYAFCRYAAIDRKTKDLDLMIKEETWPAVARALRARGINTRRTFPHWLGKALSPVGQVDIIFNGGSGLTAVDDEWFSAQRAGARCWGIACGCARPRSSCGRRRS